MLVCRGVFGLGMIGGWDAGKLSLGKMGRLLVGGAYGQGEGVAIRQLVAAWEGAPHRLQAREEQVGIRSIQLNCCRQPAAGDAKRP